MLSSNLKYLRKRLKKSQEQLADDLGINRSTYADYERGKTEPNASLLIKISEYFEIDLTELLTSDAGVPLFRQKNKERGSLSSNDIRILPVTIHEDDRKNIELVNINAIAGYTTGFKDPDFIKDLPRFSLPGLSEGTYRAFEIQGDSMPPICPGYIVIGRFIERWQDLKDGKRYVMILQRDGILFKRIVNEISQNQRLILFSDNPEFKPSTVSISEVLEAWEMVAYVGFSVENTSFNEYVFDKLHLIERKVEKILSSNTKIESY